MKLIHILWHDLISEFILCDGKKVDLGKTQRVIVPVGEEFLLEQVLSSYQNDRKKEILIDPRVPDRIYDFVSSYFRKYPSTKITRKS